MGTPEAVFLLCATLLWTSCERPRQVYAYISKGLGHSQLIHRRVAHYQKYSLSKHYIDIIALKAWLLVLLLFPKWIYMNYKSL
jgi:hypothetical protein